MRTGKTGFIQFGKTHTKGEKTLRVAAVQHSAKAKKKKLTGGRKNTCKTGPRTEERRHQTVWEREAA